MFDLHVDTTRWHAKLDQVARDAPGLVPVIKGNGYGLGRNLLAHTARRVSAGPIAVGTYHELADALDAWDGDVLVLTPWRDFIAEVTYHPRVIHTVGRVADIAALAAAAPGTRVVVEGQTSMSRHGLNVHQIAAAVTALDGLIVEGFAIHLPLDPHPGQDAQAGGNFTEANSWAGALLASQLDTTTFFVSHLSTAERERLQTARPQLTVRPRIGTSLWLGDLGAFSVQARVLDRHTVSRGERVGYRQQPVSREGTLLVVAGGTSHGIGMQAPSASSGFIQRGKALAKGGLEATGRALSPFTVNGKQRWFIEPPHMHISMIFVPGSPPSPQVGDAISAAVRYTTTTFDQIVLD